MVHWQSCHACGMRSGDWHFPLSGLHQRSPGHRLIDNTDVIPSVSGGGHTAAWLALQSYQGMRYCDRDVRAEMIGDGLTGSGVAG